MALRMSRWRFLVTVTALFLAPEVACAQGLRERVESLALELLTQVPTDRRLTVAMTEFPDLEGVTSDFSRYIAERMTTVFTQSPRVSVVERRRLAHVLAELGWSQAELLDPAKVPKIGQMTGADAVVVGTVADLGPTVDVEARLVALETGQLLGVATAAIPKDASVEALMARGRQAPSPVAALPGPVPPAPGVPAVPQEERRADHLVFFSTPGARWKFQITMEREEGLLFRRKVSDRGTWTLIHEGPVRMNAGEAFRLRGDYRVGSAAWRETFYYRVSDQTVEQVGEEHERPDGQRIMGTYEPPIVLWRVGAKPGDQWETGFKLTVQSGGSGGSEGPVSRGPGGVTIQLDALKRLLGGLLTRPTAGESGNTVKVTVGPVERVSVPLGDFDGQRVEFQRGSLTITDWHVPAVGLVKRVQASPRARMDAELVEFFIPQ